MLPKSLSCTKGFSVAILRNCQKSYIALTLPSTKPSPSPFAQSTHTWHNRTRLRAENFAGKTSPSSGCHSHYTKRQACATVMGMKMFWNQVMMTVAELWDYIKNL